MSHEAPALVVVFLLVMAGLGLVNVFFPHLAWRMSEGWKFRKQMEPSDLWILGARISGAIIVVVCLFLATKSCDSGNESDLGRGNRLQLEGKRTTHNVRINKNPIPNRVDQSAP